MSISNQPPESDDNNENQKLGFFGLMGSVLAAFFGVQKNANRKRDFEQGNYLYFIFAGIIFFILFIVGLIVFVNMLVANA